jgi:hypothetical protein
MCRAVRPSSDGRSSCGPRSSSIVSIRQLAHATPPGSKSPCAAPRRFVASANCFRSRWPSAARGARGSCRPTSRASRRVGGPLTSSRSAEAAFAPPPCQLRRESVTSFAWASARSPARPPVRRLWGRGSQPARRPILRIAETQARGEENGTGRTVSQRRSGVSFSSSCSLRVSRARANTRSRRTWQLIAGLSSPHITASGVQPLAAVVVWSARRPVASPLPPH